MKIEPSTSAVHKRSGAVALQPFFFAESTYCQTAVSDRQDSRTVDVGARTVIPRSRDVVGESATRHGKAHARSDMQSAAFVSAKVPRQFDMVDDHEGSTARVAINAGAVRVCALAVLNSHLRNGHPARASTQAQLEDRVCVIAVDDCDTRALAGDRYRLGDIEVPRRSSILVRPGVSMRSASAFCCAAPRPSGCSRMLVDKFRRS